MFHRVMKIRIGGQRGVKSVAIVDIAKPRNGMRANNQDQVILLDYLKESVEVVSSYLRAYQANKHYAAIHIQENFAKNSLLSYLKNMMIETESLTLSALFQLCADDRLCKTESFELLKQS